MSKAEAKAKRKAHERKRKAVAAKEGKKFMYIVIGIAAVMLVILYFVFRAGFGWAHYIKSVIRQRFFYFFHKNSCKNLSFSKNNLTLAPTMQQTVVISSVVNIIIVVNKM